LDTGSLKEETSRTLTGLNPHRLVLRQTKTVAKKDLQLGNAGTPGNASAEFLFCGMTQTARWAACALPFPFALGLSYYPPTTSTMPQTSPGAVSRSNYQAIFDSALEVYKKKTGKDLTSHPLLRTFETCNSPDDVLDVLQAQILAPGKPQSSGDKLLERLNPTINVLNAFSATIGGGVGLVSLYEV
jgi:hypothetical protein